MSYTNIHKQKSNSNKEDKPTKQPTITQQIIHSQCLIKMNKQPRKIEQKKQHEPSHSKQKQTCNLIWIDSYTCLLDFHINSAAAQDNTQAPTHCLSHISHKTKINGTISYRRLTQTKDGLVWRICTELHRFLAGKLHWNRQNEVEIEEHKWKRVRV